MRKSLLNILEQRLDGKEKPEPAMGQAFGNAFKWL
jgi:hypothetical protein